MRGKLKLHHQQGEDGGNMPTEELRSDPARLVMLLAILIWQAGRFWELVEDRRFRRRRKAFWERHEKNIEAIKAGVPQPYPDNSFDWPLQSANAVQSQPASNPGESAK